MKNFIFALSAAISLTAAGTSLAAPEILQYQGLIQANGTNFTGQGQFKFALVNRDGSVTLWSQDSTSFTGEEPSGPPITLPVTRGAFSVMLGDTTVPNMTQPVWEGVFEVPEVFVRVWFNDGVHGFQQLAPDQR